MHTNVHKTINLHHTVADIKIKPTDDVNPRLLKLLIQLALDSYLETDKMPASVIHSETKQRHGENYKTPGYYLRLYRGRASLTQKQLADKLAIHQHHISEMENNKRDIGKVLAKKIAIVLNLDYHKLL